MNEHTATDHELVDEENLIANQMEQPFVDSQTPEPPLSDQQNGTTTSPGTPSELPDFDWEDFEARFDKALREADEAEREILKEATGLSKVRHYSKALDMIRLAQLTATVLSSLGICCIGPRQRASIQAPADPTALRQFVGRKV